MSRTLINSELVELSTIKALQRLSKSEILSDDDKLKMIKDLSSRSTSPVIKADVFFNTLPPVLTNLVERRRKLEEIIRCICPEESDSFND